MQIKINIFFPTINFIIRKMSTKNSKNDVIGVEYKNQKLTTFPITEKTNIKDIQALISSKFGLKKEYIKLLKNNELLTDNSLLIKEIINKDKKNTIHLGDITEKFKFFQIDNEINSFDFEFDLIKTTIDSFKNTIFDFFKNKMNEINYNVSKCEFYTSNLEEEIPFFQKNQFFASHFNKSPNFYFILKDSQICFYNANNDNLEPQSEIKENNQCELRKNVQTGQKFKVVIQTYNHLIRELEVYPEMKIGELKDLIESYFLVRKEYQELLYLVYKLNDDTKMIKDFYIRPQGIIFLRGFYFPLIFVDFYEKNNKKVVSINIAEQIQYIKAEIITKFNFDSQMKYKLIFNGKELNDSNFLIDYNVQKMQVIYIK